MSNRPFRIPLRSYFSAEKRGRSTMGGDEYMWSDILLQLSIFLLIILMFLFIYGVPQRLLSRLRLLAAVRRSDLQAKRHFVLGAQLLNQARSTSDRSLAARAAAEADRSISLDPRDAASHILKALALELQGFGASALDSLDVALSPLAAGSLSGAERGEALLKRAELRLAADRGGVEEDVAESAKLVGMSARGYGLLGNWYAKGGMYEEARKAYEEAIGGQPDYGPARDGLARLNSRS